MYPPQNRKQMEEELNKIRYCGLSDIWKSYLVAKLVNDYMTQDILVFEEARELF